MGTILGRWRPSDRLPPIKHFRTTPACSRDSLFHPKSLGMRGSEGATAMFRCAVLCALLLAARNEWSRPAWTADFTFQAVFQACITTACRCFELLPLLVHRNQRHWRNMRVAPVDIRAGWWRGVVEKDALLRGVGVARVDVEGKIQVCSITLERALDQELSFRGLT